MQKEQEKALKDLIETLNEHHLKDFLALFVDDARIDAKPIKQVFDGVSGLTIYYNENYFDKKLKAKLLQASYNGGNNVTASVQLTGPNFENGSAGRKFDIEFDDTGKKIAQINIDYKVAEN